MKTISILEGRDKIEATDLCRPLTLRTRDNGASDYYSFKDEISDRPINNTRWCRVKVALPWAVGNSVSDVNKVNEVDYEFARGDVPSKHIMKVRA